MRTINSGHRPPKRLWAKFVKLSKQVGWSSANTALIAMEEDAVEKQQILKRKPKKKKKRRGKAAFTHDEAGSGPLADGRVAN